MKILHQNNPEGTYETLCGMSLDPDIRQRDDVLLATLDLDQEDVDTNFGEDAVLCAMCLACLDMKNDHEDSDLAQVIPLMAVS